MPLVITHCTKRKRAAATEALQAHRLRVGTTAQVASDWASRLVAAPAALQAKDLYAGRGMVEARRAADATGGRFAIISAGLGLVDGDTFVPAYSLTTIKGDPDDIRRKTGADRSEWWPAIQGVSPFAQSDRSPRGLILAAVSTAYLEMVAEDWSAWPSADLGRLRLFSKAAPTGAAEALRPAWMPYDDRLDGVGHGLAGTQGDFAQRAMRHFATQIRPTGTQQDDREAVLTALSGVARRQVPVRKRLEDAALKDTIRAEWGAACGQSSTMLRRLRDTLGLACEQGRFRTLFNEVKAERTA